MLDEKRLYYFLAVKEILELFAEQELGSTCEINVENVLSYINSIKFAADTFEVHADKEEIFRHVTDDILAGYPVWQLLDMSDWTRNMIEREFTNKLEQERKKLEQTFKCYSCKYFEEHETALGMLQKCHRPKLERWNYSREPHKLKKRCKDYEQKE